MADQEWEPRFNPNTHVLSELSPVMGLRPGYYLLSSCHRAGTAPGSPDTSVHRTERGPCPERADAGKTGHHKLTRDRDAGEGEADLLFKRGSQFIPPSLRFLIYKTEMRGESL